MALTEQQILEARKKFGISEGGIGSTTVSAVENVARRRRLAAEHDARQEEEKGFLGRAKEAVGERFQEIKKTAGERIRREISPPEALIRTAGDVVGAGLDVVSEAIISATPGPLKEVGMKMLETKVGQEALESINRGVESYNEWKSRNHRVAETLEGALNIASVFPVGAGARVGAKTGISATKRATQVGKAEFGDIVTSVQRKAPELSERATKLLATEPSEQVVNILETAPTKKFDNFVDVARESSKDFKAPTGFEIVGDSMADAAKQIQKQLSSIGQQKANILKKAKVGLVEFKDSPRRAILAVSKMDDSALKKKVMKKLKAIKTKADADRAIDEIQDLIFSATQTKTLAGGSRAEKQLKKIIGKMNSELKETLPDSYVRLNDKFAKNIGALNKLNKSLGDSLDGVPLRGATLVKQFFSPSGRTAKELFDFIKKNTGVDLAEDVVLAKFTAELFNDPKVRSLLETLPRGRRGVIEEAAGAFLEKTGIGKKVRETIREGKIEKARGITK